MGAHIKFITFDEFNAELKQLKFEDYSFYSEVDKQGSVKVYYGDEMASYQVGVISGSFRSSHSTNYASFRALDEGLKLDIGILFIRLSFTPIENRGMARRHQIRSKFAVSTKEISSRKEFSMVEDWDYILAKQTGGVNDSVWTQEEIAALPTDMQQYINSEFCLKREVL